MTITDTEIIQEAQQRFKQLNEVSEFFYGDFDLPLAKGIIAKVVVHDGKIKYIEVPDPVLGCRRKILG